MAVPLLDLSAQHTPLLPEFRSALDGVLTSGKFVVPSPEIDRLEKSLGELCQTLPGVVMSSGTDALLAALMALSIGPGDEVITTPFTFFATAGCIARVGAKPVFVDIDPLTYNIDPLKIEAALTTRTKAIMPVHLFGLLADMPAINALAQKRGLKVIEDAAQAIGAGLGGKPACAWGDIGCLSFYPTKNLGALGDGGACVTHDPALDKLLRQFRLHGQSGEYQHDHIGGNFRLDAMQAALLNVKYAHLDEWTQARRERACRYHELLTGLPIGLPGTPEGYHHVYNQYTVRVPDGQRDELRKHLLARGIGCRVYYPLALHLQPCFAYLGYEQGSFPESERAMREVLSLPMYPELKADQQLEVASAVKSFFGTSN
ncbi:MAG: DegT/DnrJ/EryC1/StrS family aminotransferase [Phycisphaerales bacterium]|nr:DegT/DnrJ/EryC1/StrS family aminotransferase [Phycisphaerales bacterium]